MNKAMHSIMVWRGVTTSSFSECKQAVISAIDEKISHLSTKEATEKTKNPWNLKDEMIIEELKMLQNKFVILIDRASGIIAFVYQSTMLKFSSMKLAGMILIT